MELHHRTHPNLNRLFMRNPYGSITSDDVTVTSGGYCQLNGNANIGTLHVIDAEVNIPTSDPSDITIGHYDQHGASTGLFYGQSVPSITTVTSDGDGQIVLRDVHGDVTMTGGTLQLDGTIAGNLTLGAATTLEDYDQIQGSLGTVDGRARIDGKVVPLWLPTGSFGTAIAVVNAAGGITGTPHVVLPNLASPRIKPWLTSTSIGARVGDITAPVLARPRLRVGAVRPHRMRLVAASWVAPVERESGVIGYSWVVTANPHAAPDHHIDLRSPGPRSVRVRVARGHRWRIVIEAEDADGNWSAPVASAWLSVR
jgi:hypothetical protein